MFNFLFGRRGKAEEPVIETQRQTFERLVSEINAQVDLLPEKPKVTIDPASGHITLEAPEQFPDEALALPEPEKAQEPEAPEPPAEPEPEAKPEETAEAVEIKPDEAPEKEQKLAS